MAQEKVPKSMAKAAARNTKVVKQYEPSKKARIDRIISESKAKTTTKKRKPSKPKKKKQIKPEIPDKKSYFLANYADKKDDMYCSVESFEKSVYLLEGIKVVLRAPTYAKVGRYNYKRKCSGDTSIKDFIDRRIMRSIDSTYQVYVVSDKEFSLSDSIETIRNYRNSNKLV